MKELYFRAVLTLTAAATILLAGEPACAQVKGTASYRERMALPPDAVFEATLEDLSRTDARAEVIGRARIERPGNPPIAFEIPYDTSKISPRGRYAVRARILVGSGVLFITDQYYPVLSDGKGTEVTLMLRRLGGSASTASLENTYWKLTYLGDKPIPVIRSAHEPHLILHPDTRRASGTGGCNRFTGSYELKADQLTFGETAGTMMACMDGMETEKEFFAALMQVRKAKVSGQQLELLDAEDKPAARFEAVYMK